MENNKHLAGTNESREVAVTVGKNLSLLAKEYLTQNVRLDLTRELVLINPPACIKGINTVANS